MLISILISITPTLALLLLGATVWYTDPSVRAERARTRTQ